MDLELFVGSEIEMRAFAETHKRYFADLEKRHEEAVDTTSLNDSLLASAFTGELTTEWEIVNADWINAQTKLHERLPRLLLLVLIQAEVARAKKAAQTTILVTALMKYAFLLQMEGATGLRFYNFIPYYYGPFAKELYADLETLKAQGLINVENGDGDKTRITLSNPEKIESALSELPDDIREDVKTIIDSYGGLDHNALLKKVYEKYPAYATKSRLRRKSK